MNSQVTYIKWFWNYSGILVSAEVKFRNTDGNCYYCFRQGKAIVFYDEELFDSAEAAYVWKLNRINKVISESELDKVKLLVEMNEARINIGNY